MLLACVCLCLCAYAAAKEFAGVDSLVNCNGCVDVCLCIADPACEQ